MNAIHLYTNSLKIIPLHSTITVEEQSKVFDIPENGQRKVYTLKTVTVTVDSRYYIDGLLLHIGYNVGNSKHKTISHMNLYKRIPIILLSENAKPWK